MSTLQGDADVIVVKLSPDLKTLLYSTFLGGSGEDLGRTAAVDPFGNFIIGGWTRSSNFPTVNGLQGYHGASYDGMFAKFSPAP
jgi:hypothetical protein